jgi:HEAT repeat protein
VLETANLASARSTANLPRLIGALEDASEPVRWWAAQGCAMLGARAASAMPSLQGRLTDASGGVQVAAAEALARMNEMGPALATLERWIRQDQKPAFALQAANVLDRLGGSARPALPAMKAALAEAREAKGRYTEYLERILTHAIDSLEKTGDQSHGL